ARNLSSQISRKNKPGGPTVCPCRNPELAEVRPRVVMVGVVVAPRDVLVDPGACGPHLGDNPARSPPSEVVVRRNVGAIVIRIVGVPARREEIGVAGPRWDRRRRTNLSDRGQSQDHSRSAYPRSRSHLMLLHCELRQATLPCL